MYFSRFQPFLIILNLFQWFHIWDQQKTCENEQKKVIFVYCSKLVYMQKLVDPLRGYIKNVANGWKKVVQPAFECAQHPKAGRSTQHTFIFKIKFLDFLFRYLLLLDTFLQKYLAKHWWRNCSLSFFFKMSSKQYFRHRPWWPSGNVTEWSNLPSFKFK